MVEGSADFYEFYLVIQGLHGSASLSPAKRGLGCVYMGDRVVYMGLKVFYMGEELSPM